MTGVAVVETRDSDIPPVGRSLLVVMLFVLLSLVAFLAATAREASFRTELNPRELPRADPAVLAVPRSSVTRTRSGADTSGDVSLAPVLASSGCSLRVNVRDPRGRIVGFIPVALALEPEDGGKKIFRRAYANAAGEVGFAELPRGSAEIGIVAANLFGRIQDPLRAQLETDLEFILLAPGLLGYRGRFEPPPEPGFDAVLETIEEPFFGTEVRRMAVGEDGAFVFEGLCPDRHRLSLQRGASPWWEGDKTFLTLEFELFATQAGAVHRLVPPVFISGRLEAEDCGDALSLYLENEQTGGWRMIQGWGSRGFHFEELTPGNYHFEVWTHFPRRTVLCRSLELQASLEDLVIQVPRPITAWAGVHANERPPASARLALVLTDPDGHRLEEQTFWCMQPQSELVFFPTGCWNTGYHPRCEEDRIELLGLRPGRWKLEASLDGFAPVVREFDAQEGVIVDVRFERLAGRVVRPSWNGKHEIDVRRAGTSEPWRRLLWDSGLRACNAETPGVRTAVLAPGSYSFRMRGFAFAETIIDSITIADDPRPLVLSCEPLPGHALRGRMFTGDGIPLSGGRVHVHAFLDGTWRPMPWKETCIRSGPEPHFEVVGLLPGRYLLSLDSAGDSVVGEFELESGDVERTFYLDL